MPLISFTRNLKRFFPELQSRHIEADDVAGLIAKLNDFHPGIKDYIIKEDGSLREHVNIFIGNELMNDRVHLRDKLGVDDQVYVMQALSGG